MAPVELDGSTIVITGATGQVAEPVAIALAASNEVVAGARFRDAAARHRLESAGVRCVPIDLLSGDVSGLPADADYVVNFAVAKSNEWEKDLRANSGGLAYLMEHHRDARAFLHCSTTGLYKPMGHHVFAEGDPLGDNHGVWPFLRTYSICKIAAEATALWAADRFGLPTTIARLSVPYGDRGGWPAIHLEMMINGTDIPVHVDAPERVPPDPRGRHHRHGARAARGGDARRRRWSTGAASQSASIEEWCGYLGELTGLTPGFAPTTETIDSVEIDLTRMHELVGPTSVAWKDGMRRMVESPATPSCSAADPPDHPAGAPPVAAASGSGGVGRSDRPGAPHGGTGDHQPLALHEDHGEFASGRGVQPAGGSRVGGEERGERLGPAGVETVVHTVDLEVERIGHHHVGVPEPEGHTLVDHQAREYRVLEHELEPAVG